MQYKLNNYHRLLISIYGYAGFNVDCPLAAFNLILKRLKPWRSVADYNIGEGCIARNACPCVKIPSGFYVSRIGLANF